MVDDVTPNVFRVQLSNAQEDRIAQGSTRDGFK